MNGSDNTTISPIRTSSNMTSVVDLNEEENLELEEGMQDQDA